MPNLKEIRENGTLANIFEGQLQHIGIATLMSFGALILLTDGSDDPTLLGLTSRSWGAVSIFLALIHQIIVALVFRLQLYRGLMTRLFGDRYMRIWAVIFLPLLAARPITLILTGWADAGTLSGFRPPEIVIGFLLLATAIWGMHSVLVYFTIPRALGGDHFRDSYAAMPMVDKGAFHYTANAMYGIVFLGLWGIALLFGSWNALVVALFQHAYIWVHMYCTEKPDMDRIYGSP